MMPRLFQNYISLIVRLFILQFILQDCMCIRFFLQPHQKRCLKHEMYPNQLAVGEYEISELSGTTVDLTITDSKGHTALNREDVQAKGKFAVTSDYADIHELCFSLTVPPGGAEQQYVREVSVDFRVGAEAKEYSSDDVDMLGELEKDFNRIEDLSNSIIGDFAYLKKRGREMRDTNDSTNRRLFYQTVTSVIILLALTAWQILYLRTFFRARKLID